MTVDAQILTERQLLQQINWLPSDILWLFQSVYREFSVVHYGLLKNGVHRSDNGAKD